MTLEVGRLPASLALLEALDTSALEQESHASAGVVAT